MQDITDERLNLIGCAIGLVFKCPYSETKHINCYLEYIRKGRTNDEMVEYIKTMSNKQLRRLISHHGQCPMRRNI